MTDVVQYDPTEFGDVGMEDVGAGDIILPRISILHKEGKFRDNLSKAEFKELDVVLLGLVKQRIMWDDDVEDGDKPQCKSPDFDHGYPQMREDIPRAKQFPWDLSNFNKDDFPAGPDGLRVLPCDSCVFNQWTKDPRTGKSVPPMCSEQHTYPIRYSGDGGESWTTALITFARTGIKPSKQYMSSFVQSKMPFFTYHTNLSLSMQTRGSVEYSVPIFKRGEPTSKDEWLNYANQYRQIRDFIRSAPRAQGGDEDAPASSNVNTAPAAPAPAAAATPPPAAPVTPAAEPTAQASPAPAYVTDDDLPF